MWAQAQVLRLVGEVQPRLRRKPRVSERRSAAAGSSQNLQRSCTVSNLRGMASMLLEGLTTWTSSRSKCGVTISRSDRDPQRFTGADMRFVCVFVLRSWSSCA
jgi:hypothetical protein